VRSVGMLTIVVLWLVTCFCSVPAGAATIAVTTNVRKALLPMFRIDSKASIKHAFAPHIPRPNSGAGIFVDLEKNKWQA
jgi:hypothetical protein